MAKAIRERSYKVRMSLAEVETLKEANVLNIAKFLRDSALNAVNKKEQKNFYSKVDRDFVLELSRIGNNINQIAHTVNAQKYAADSQVDRAVALVQRAWRLVKDSF